MAIRARSKGVVIDPDGMRLVRARLDEFVVSHGSVRAFAEANGWSYSMISQVACGVRAPGPELCRLLGLVRVTTFREARGAD